MTNSLSDLHRYAALGLDNSFSFSPWHKSLFTSLPDRVFSREFRDEGSWFRVKQSITSIPFESRKFPHPRAAFQGTLRGIDDAHSHKREKSTNVLLVGSPGNSLAEYQQFHDIFSRIFPVHLSYTFHAPMTVCPAREAPSRFLGNIQPIGIIFQSNSH
jgi:hypothetical protein